MRIWQASRSFALARLLLMADDAIHERFYRPRAAWIWDRKLNPNLETRVDLRVHLQGPAALTPVHAWLEEIGARRVAENVYVRGGAAIEIEHATTAGSTLLLSSGGQDALESLDELVLTFHEFVLTPQPGLTVAWQELPTGST